MPYTLNSAHPLFANLIELIGVDAGALVSLKTARTFTTVGTPSFGTGTYGAHFASVGGGFNHNGATFSPPISILNSATPNTTIFIVTNALTATGGEGRRTLFDGADKVAIGLGNTTVATAYSTQGAGVASTVDISTGAHILALTRTGETAHSLYVDAAAAVTGAALGFNSEAVSYTNIGGSQGQNSVSASIVWIAVFNKALTSTEVADLRASVAAGNVIGLVTGAVVTPVAFTGTVPAQSRTVGVASSLSLASFFSGTQTPFSYSVFSGTLPAGLTLNASTGVISGTPTTAGTANIVVRATDSSANTANTNSFAITVAAAVTAGITVTDALSTNNGTVLANQTGVRVSVVKAVDLVGVYALTGTTTNASGMLPTISDAAIIAGTAYHVVIKLADGSVGVTQAITAS